MLKLWGYASLATCVLCGKDQCTLHHILVNCPFALNQGRYTWRHDSILQDLDYALRKLVTTFNSRKPRSFAEVARKDYKASFVRAGTRKKMSAPSSPLRLLDFANDWKMQIDLNDNKLVFPPIICSTNLRPDIVLWSPLSRTVILLELTCCAEEGTENAHVRKEARYADLMSEIVEAKWTPTLLTLEVGARGLVGSRTYRALTKLGFTGKQAKTVCKSVSEIASRCSYAIYLAHSSLNWCHNNDYVCGPKPAKENELHCKEERPSITNIVYMREKGVVSLYHFTDASNLKSIRKNGLMSAANLSANIVTSKLNSNERSRELDAAYGLQNYVRLSLCPRNPMMYVAVKEGRISAPVLLKISLEVVSRPNVMFSDMNTTHHEAKVGESPEIIRFDVTKAKSQFDVNSSLRKFYQAEVLVPSPIPPHLITFPKKPLKISKSVVEKYQDVPVAPISRSVPVGVPAPPSIELKVETKRITEKMTETNVVGNDEKMCEKRCDEENGEKQVVDFGVITIGCEFPMQDSRLSCKECHAVGRFINCSKHMQKCGRPIHISCADCDRLLCAAHMQSECYCRNVQMYTVRGMCLSGAVPPVDVQNTPSPGSY